jgi:hypothetical protein
MPEEAIYYHPEPAKNRVRADLIGSGKHSPGIAFIYEPASSNPLVEVPEPIEVHHMIAIGLRLMGHKPEHFGEIVSFMSKTRATSNTSFAFVPIQPNEVRVDVALGCGNRFEGVAWITNADKDAFSLKMPKGLGCNAIIAIIHDWAKQRRDYNPETKG